jgi:sarcosine oxidase
MAGAATSRSLARRGHRVLLLEQFSIGHSRGSSHGPARLFRFSYHDPAYVRMAIETLPLWRDLETEMDVELLTTTGGLDAGRSLDTHVAALSACEADFELLDGAEVAERWPGVRLARDEPVLFQPDAGVVRADASVRALIDSATSHGTEVRVDTPVRSIRRFDDRVEVDAAGDLVRARVVVVAAGAWARRLLAPAGIALPVTPTRESVAYFDLEETLSMPALVEWSDPAFYALANPGRGLKAGLHHGGPVTDPDEEGSVSRATVESLAARVSELYPNAAPEPFAAETCIYTNTEDERFVLERHGRVVVGSACSGHGFKFAPWTGERLAELAVEALEV